jgi:hypothetical protein
VLLRNAYHFAGGDALRPGRYSSTSPTTVVWRRVPLTPLKCKERVPRASFADVLTVTEIVIVGVPEPRAVYATLSRARKPVTVMCTVPAKFPRRDRVTV